ncbi:MAG: IMP dehydrogenase [Mycoplasmoidaceae bacterium]
MNNFKNMSEGITFADVLLVPQKSSILPSEVILKTNLTSNIILNIPLISAAMSSVTESKMAISIARSGGIGIIHKNISIEEQANQVDIVKRSESGMITDPISVYIDSTIYDINQIMKKYKISGLPVVDKGNYLQGIITNRDIKYVTSNQKLISVKEFMTPLKKLIVAKEGIKLEKAKEILWKNRIEKLPLINDKGQLKGLITSKDIDKSIIYPLASKDKLGRLLVGAAVGTSPDTLERVKKLEAAAVDVIVIDSAHGHSSRVIETIKLIRAKFPKLEIIAGNIVTKKAAMDLIDAGANAIKVGVGPGSICTTRIIAGVGYPQLSAISEVYEYAKTKKIPVIGDGGIKYSGDITKALAAGASAVMLGSIFAGSEESPGEEIVLNGRKYKSYIGMGSIGAMSKGSSDRYFQSGTDSVKFVPEGIESRVPYRGKVNDIIYQLVGGVKSGMGYCGCKTILELVENAKWVKISNASLQESHPHGVVITKESPNYQISD